MTRNLLAVAVALLATACACNTAVAPAANPPLTPAASTPTTQSIEPSTPPAAAASASPDCNPGHSLLNAVLWLETSAEYRATALATYANARRALDAALADPQWIGTDEDTATTPPQPPAIVLDLDETSLDNSTYETRMVQSGRTYDKAAWKTWVNEAGAGAVPGATEFLSYAKSRGVTPFYITNRDWPEEEPGTRANLERLGFPIDAAGDTLLMRGEGQFKESDKGPRRALVASKYRILLVLGDDLNDFVNARDSSKAERDEIIRRTAENWGTRWFMLPNPMYGSFERVASGSGGTPCETVQRKVNALEMHR